MFALLGPTGSTAEHIFVTIGHSTRCVVARCCTEKKVKHFLQRMLAQTRAAAVEERERSRAAATYGQAWVSFAQKENKCKVCERYFERDEQRQAFCHRYTAAGCVLSTSQYGPRRGTCSCLAVLQGYWLGCWALICLDCWTGSEQRLLQWRSSACRVLQASPQEEVSG